jgi:hypothetical protein
MAKQLNVYSKDDTREEVIIMTEDDFEAVCNLHNDLVGEEFAIDGVLHKMQNFDMTVDTVGDDEEDDIYEDDYSSVEDVIEVLNSFHS